MHTSKITHTKMCIYQIELTAAIGQIHIHVYIFLNLKISKPEMGWKNKRLSPSMSLMPKQHMITNFCLYRGVWK